jgi:truncated hemoglobin YjbI
LSVAAVGCTDDDTAVTTTTTDAGAGEAAATDSGKTDTLYKRLGEHKGIRAALEAVVTDELKDPEVASFFVLLNDPTTNVRPDHPTADQLLECLTNQLGKAAGGAEEFPTKLGADKGSFQCRDMKTAHANLHISAGTFDKFVGIAAATLKRLGVADADITVVGGVLVSTKADIVDPAAPDGGSFDAGAKD